MKNPVASVSKQMQEDIFERSMSALKDDELEDIANEDKDQEDDNNMLKRNV